MPGSGNVLVDSFAGISWLSRGGDANITYHFNNALGFHNWTANEMASYRAALQQFANVANITTQEVFSATGADFSESWVSDTYMQANHGNFGGWHQYPTTMPAARGEFNFERLSGGGASIWSNNSMLPGGRGFRLFMHEIGHGLGLAHAHDTDMGTNLLPGVVLDSDLGTNSYNQHVYSIMSYNEGPFQTSNANIYGHSATPMAFDIAAIQFLYGANSSYQSGSDTYILPTLNAAGATWRCLWDTGGNDTISCAAATTAATIDLRAATLTNGDPNAGGFISQVLGIFGGVTIANGVVIENAVGGSGNDTLTGNSAANTLNGGAGIDAMTGGDGNDIYFVDNAGDTIVETNAVIATGGFDIVVASANTTLSANVEQLVLNGTATSGTGNDTANILYGLDSFVALTLIGAGGDDVIYGSTAGSNTLIGGSGVDTLLGYGGNNTMQGGLGSDIYYTYTATDIISEAGGDGIDTVYANYTFTAGEGLEQIIIYGDSTGAASTSLTDNNIIYGNSANRAVILDGGGGSDVLFGGVNSDTLIGGDGVDLLFGFDGTNILTGGNDTDIYYSQSTTDIITETATGGFDTLYSQANVTNLAANVEQVILYGAATIGTGNSQDNYVYGNISGNALTLDGGAGADYVYGSAQNDTLIGGTGNDQIDLRGGGNDSLVFAAGSGNDLVYGFDSDPAQAGQDTLNLAGRGLSAASIGGAITIAASGADTLITIGPDTIRLVGVSSATITAADFTF